MMAPIPDSGSETLAPSEHREFGPRVMSEADHTVFTQAFDAADRGDWGVARALAAQGKDRIAREIIEWRYLLDETGGATFDEIDRFLRDHPDWPRRDTLLARAEKAMPEDARPQSVITWFSSREPATGFGQIHLGEALMANGKRKEGADLIRRGWIEHSYQPSDEIAILTKHSDVLTPDAHKKRLERLLWNDDLADAERQMARVDGDIARIAEARIKLTRDAGGNALKIAAKFPASMRGDPGVIFAEARALRREGDIDRAGPMLLRASRGGPARDYPDAWWDERHLMAREAIKNEQYKLAYQLVSENHLTPGSDYTDAEFLAGWLALRFLKKPELALGHFENLVAHVGTPISKARAQYWLGRASEALGERGEAWQHYHQAAQWPAAFYGQLAEARIEDRPVLHLTETQPDTTALRAAFEADDRVYAMRVLSELGEDNLLRTFSAHVALESPDAAHVALLAELMTKLGEPALAVRAAKQTSYNGSLLLSYLYPVIDVPRVPGLASPPEPALALAITRQETEFDPDAVSHAGALGLMQIMPGSGRATASAHGLRFSLSDLISDPQYNMQIGQAEFSDHLALWNGSYVLAAAAYNAGDSNVRKWIRDYGDPRTGATNPEDWIETIPFDETRNYVMRVLDNTQVYRNRLSGSDQPLSILSDLYRPRTPEIAVLHAPANEAEGPSKPEHAEKSKKKKHKVVTGNAASP